MRAAFALLVPFAPVLVASLASCAPAIDPAMRANVDREIAAAPHDTTYPAPATHAPAPLAVGQWTRLKVVRSDGVPSVATYKVVGQEGDAFWIETVNERYTGRSVLKMLVAFGDRTDPAQIDIRRLIVKQGSHAPQDFPPSMIGLVRGTYASVAQGLVLRWDGLPQETKRAAAGTFTDAFKASTQVHLYGYSSRATTWSHPAVPIQGLVHSDNEDGAKVDLLDFGMTGAASEL
jgi:hypothetical protein